MTTTEKTKIERTRSLTPFQRSVRSTLIQLTPYALSCLVVAGSALAVHWEWGRLAAMDRQRFDALAERVHDEINDRLFRYTHELVGISSTLVDERGVDASLLSHVVTAQEISKELPGAIGIGFIRLNASGGSERSWDDFHSYTLNVDAFEPSAQANAIIGKDISAFSARKIAAESALLSGKPRFSHATPLMESPTHSIGFQLAVPAYRTVTIPASEATRLREGIGWTYLPITATGLFAGAEQEVSNEVDVAIFDGKSVSRETLIFNSAREPSAGSDTNDDFRYTGRPFTNWTTVTFDDLSLTLALTTSSHFHESSRSSIWLIVFLGTSATFLLFNYCQHQARSLLGAQAHARLADRDLKRLALALETTTDAVIISDELGQIEWANDAFLTVSGYSLSEVLGKRPGSFLQFEKTDQATVREIRAALQERRPCHHTIQNRSKSGREYWLDLTIQPIYESNGSFSGFLAVERDVTAQLLQAESLKREKERADLALSGASLGLWDWNVATGEVVYDQRWAEMLGECATDLAHTSETWSSRVHPEDLARAYANIQQHFNRETMHYEVEIRMRHKDGSWRWILARGRVSNRKEDGSPLRMVGTHLDLTERRLAQIELERQEQVIEQTSRIAKVGWWEYQIPEERLIWSKQVRTLYEVSDDFVPSVEASISFFESDGRSRVEQCLQAAIQQGTPWDIELLLCTARNNRIWVRVMGEPVVVDGSVVAVRGSIQDISDQVATRNAISHALGETRTLRDALDQHSIFSTADRSGRIIEINDAFCAISGYSREELLGQDHRILNSGFHPKSFWIDAWKRIANGQAWRAEVCNRRKDGSLYWVDSTIVPFMTEGGIVEKYISIRFDITDKKLAEKNLRDSEERWSFAIEGSGDGVWDWNVLEGTVHFSKQWKAILGFEQDEILNHLNEWTSRVHSPDLPIVLAEIQTHLEGNSSTINTEHQIRCKNGSSKWVLTRGLVVRRDESGQPLRVVGTLSDISTRKHLELAMEANQRLLEQANSALEEAQSVGRLGNWSYDLRTKTMEWSKELYHLFGRDLLLGPPDYTEVLSSYVPDAAKQLDHAIQTCITQGIPYSLTLKTLAENQDVHFVRVEGRARQDNGAVAALFGTASDVTQEVEQQQQLKIAQIRAEEANQSKGEFLANMSHEIRTPMNGVLGMTHLLLDSPLTPEQREYAETVVKSAESLLVIINDILDFSKIEAGKVTIINAPFSVASLMTRIERLLEVRATERNVALLIDHGESVPEYLFSDETRIGQVLLNLIGNALKFSLEGGAVWVQLGFDEAHETEHTFHLTISDTGIGIDAEKCTRIFEPFTQADQFTTKRFGGTGLGLSISRQLVEMMGGKIWVDSRVGVGSVFHVTIPVTEAPEPIKEAPPATLPQTELSPSTKLHIMLVEDNLVNQKIALKLLERCGYQVLLCSDGQEAVDAFKASKSAYDVILMDCQMPRLSGYEATEQIRDIEREQGRQRVPIIAMTANAMKGDKEKCLGVGMDDYVSKPFTPTQLYEAIARWAGKPGTKNSAAVEDNHVS